MRLGVDIDDVLYPWHAQDPTWPDLTGPRLKVSLYEAAPYPGVREALQRLLDAGHTVHLVTARSHEGTQHSQEIRDLTRRWLARHKIPHDSLHFAPDKTSIRTDVFIDDDPGNCRQLEAAGIQAFLREQPWNRSARDLDWVDDLTDFVDLVLASQPCG